MHTQDLVENILKHRRLYYAGTPEISDSKYDELEASLKRKLPDHPLLQEVGITTENLKVKHQRPMLSLAKTYNIQDAISWVKSWPIVAVGKIDGISLSLIYEQGNLVQAKTRGNGYLGEDVTHKIRWIANCPQKIPELNGEIRGELACRQEKFHALCDEMRGLGLEEPSSPRNIVAGLMGRKEYHELCRFFDFYAFELFTPNIHTEWDKLQKLADYKFQLPTHALLKNQEEVQKYLETFKEINSEVLVDGVVLTLNDLDLHKKLGHTSHHPRYRLAFKWEGERATSIIQEIRWETSRFGQVMPVAKINPVQLSGAQIQNVSLHNVIHVLSLRLKPGDEISLIRSGEVIPKFLSVIKSTHGISKVPAKCPSCSAALELRCSGEVTFPNTLLEQCLFLAKTLKIKQLTKNVIHKLITSEKINKIKDLLSLRPEDFPQHGKEIHQQIKEAGLYSILHSTGLITCGHNYLKTPPNPEELKLKKEENVPQRCNSCQQQPQLLCTNTHSCPSQQQRRILHWIQSVGIEELSEKRLQQIIDAGLINHTADLYKLETEDLLELDKIKEKLATKLIAQIQSKRQVPLRDFLCGLGIAGCGKTSWDLIIKDHPSLEEILNLEPEQIEVIPGFAEKTAKQITRELEARKEDIQLLQDVGVEIKKTTANTQSLAGYNLAISGSFHLPRKQITTALQAAGAQVSSQVSRQTTALILADPNSKSKKTQQANELGIPIWSIEKLKELLKGLE